MENPAKSRGSFHERRKNDSFALGVRVADAVDKELHCGILRWDAGMLADMVLKNPGNYVEVGVGYGGSLITVALVRKQFGVPGRIIGVDSFPGTSIERMHSFLFTNRKIVEENLKYFKVDDIVEIVQADSHPWPLPNDTFSCALIDGWHEDDMPVRDWLSLKDRVTGQIMFHDREFEDVARAIVYALAEPGWRMQVPVGMSISFSRREIE